MSFLGIMNMLWACCLYTVKCFKNTLDIRIRSCRFPGHSSLSSTHPSLTLTHTVFISTLTHLQSHCNPPHFHSYVLIPIIIHFHYHSHSSHPHPYFITLHSYAHSFPLHRYCVSPWPSYAKLRTPPIKSHSLCSHATRQQGRSWMQQGGWKFTDER